MSSPLAETKQTQLEALNQRLKDLGLRGFWQLEFSQIRPEPQVWRWHDIYSSLRTAGELVQLNTDSARRNVSLDVRSSANIMGFQMVLPGETARAHRHTPSALRFIVQGKGAYTTSDGERMWMEPGDLLIQPNWTWHDHNNPGIEPVVWIDILDSGLVRFLEGYFLEDWAEGESQPLTKAEDYSSHRYGHVRSGLLRQKSTAVPFRYKWSETLRILNELAANNETDPYDGILMEYVNPVTGGHAFTTMSCYIQMLCPGEETYTHRHTGTVVYHVVQGEGVAKLGWPKTDKELDWRDKDCFLIPSWSWHRFQNTSETDPLILFSRTNRPVLEATALYREEMPEAMTS
jgi:gentisate 1,2-dioxygenase